MKQTQDKDPGRVVLQGNKVVVEGALHFDNVSSLSEEAICLFAGFPKTIRVDLSCVTQSDSSGVALLLAWTRAAIQEKKKLVFIEPPAFMRDLCRISELDDILPLG